MSTTAASTVDRVLRSLTGRYPGLRQALLLLPTTLVFIFFAYALYLMLGTSFHPFIASGQIGTTWTLGNYQKAFGDSLYLTSLAVTFRLSIVATACAVLLGYPVAYQIARSDRAIVRTLLIALVAIPFLTNVVVRLYALTLVLGNSGLVNIILRDVGLIGEDEGLSLMRNETGVAIGLIYFVLPFVVLTLVTSLRRLDARLEEAAQSLGATRTETFIFVTLPLSMPGVLGATMLSFGLCIPAFLTPLILGQGTVHMMANMIYDQVLFVRNEPFGAALAVVTLISSMLLIYLQGKFARGMHRG